MQAIDTRAGDVRPDHTPPPPHFAVVRWPRWTLAAVLVIAVVGFYALSLNRYFSWDFVRTHLDAWKAHVQDHLVVALLLFFVVYVSVTALSLPSAAILTMVVGALFGRSLGTAVVSVASTLGATLAFLSSRYVLRDWVQSRLGDRLKPINRGVNRDGVYYLFILRLVPAVPFFVINLGMGLTPMRVTAFAAVSWVGMLLGTFLYVNAGTELAALDSPGDVLSWKVLGSLALLGIVPLGIRKLVQCKVRMRTVGLVTASVVLLAVASFGVRTYLRYKTADTMEISIHEYSNAEYPEDPADRSLHHGQYNGRRLRLIKRDANHFDFAFEPDNPHVAKVVFRNVDVGLMTPSLPEWTKADQGLVRIALTDRQWNRQQVQFGGPHSPHVEVTGGDGWEKENLYSAELAKNCLNAGLWEVLLFTREESDKALYYQGWFSFPLGHYKELFEGNTRLSYWKHWHYLEHWLDPAGTFMSMDRLREVVRERDVAATFDSSERAFAAGEQIRKRRTTIAENIRTWGDFYDGRKVRFASFIPPGRYSVNHPWKNHYLRMDRFGKAIFRDIKSPSTDKQLHELELLFSSTKREGVCRFIVSGFDLGDLPRLPLTDYPKGMYMPMGIGTPPFFQSYEELQKNPPDKDPYFSVLLDENGKWLDHHSFAIDGPVLHRDDNDPHLLHVYLLSYERHSLIAHVVVSVKE